VIHKITKLENHEGNEITVEDIVVEYYADPGKYFEISSSSTVDKITSISAVY
jgi:hypothetical protein